MELYLKRDLKFILNRLSRFTPLNGFSLCACLMFCSVTFFAGCSGQGADSFQGYVEGEFAYMASSQGGNLEQLLVRRGDTVADSTLLFRLENTEEAAQKQLAEQELSSAQAKLEDLLSGKRPDEIDVVRGQLAAAKAQAAYSAVQFERDKKLHQKGFISTSDFDASRAAYDADTARVQQMESQIKSDQLPGREEQIRAQEANVKAASAALRKAQWQLDQKEVRAAQGGLIYDTIYVEGEWVVAGRPVVKMLAPGNVKIRFFVPETTLGSLRVGQPVKVAYDGADKAVDAVINYISAKAEYTPPVIYSNETRSKLVFMIEARPAARQDAVALHPGQPVEVRLSKAQQNSGTGVPPPVSPSVKPDADQTTERVRS